MNDVDDHLEVLLISVKGVQNGIEKRQFANRIGEDAVRDEETERLLALLGLARDKCGALMKFLQQTQRP